MQIILNCSQPRANQHFLVSFYFKELSIWGIFLKKYVQPFINVFFWISYAYLFNVKYFARKALYWSTIFLSTRLPKPYDSLRLPRWLSDKESTSQCRRSRRYQFHSCIRENPLEEEIAAPCSIVAWKTPRTEEPGGLQSGTT